MLFKSKYNFYIFNPKKELIIYNSLQGLNSIFKTSNPNVINFLLKNNDEKIDSDTMNFLKTKGIIFEKKFDEFFKAKNFINNVIYSNTLILILFPTEKCNFRCKYCYESFEQKEMTDETIDNILGFVRNNIHKFNGLHVMWFGGEPLLAFEKMKKISDKLIEICIFFKKRYESSITTNGFLLSKSMFLELLKLKITRYQVTLDGTQKIHDFTRPLINGNNTFNRIIKNLEEIKAITNRRFYFVIRINITKDIFDNITECFENVEQLVKGDSRFSTTFYKVGNWLNKIDYRLKYRTFKKTDEMILLYEKILNYKGILNINNKMLNPGTGICYAGRENTFLIRPNGEITKCTIEFANNNYKIGNFDERGNIHKNDTFYEMISDPDKCKKIRECKYFPICGGNSCPLKKFQKNFKCIFPKKAVIEIIKILDKEGKVEKYNYE